MKIYALSSYAARAVSTGGTGKSFIPNKTLLNTLKQSISFIITDPFDFSRLAYEYSVLPQSKQRAFLATNNWRKMHGFPLRRGAVNKNYKDNEFERQVLLNWERMGVKFGTTRIDDPVLIKSHIPERK